MKLLIINPGSTSTKISLYDEDTVLMEKSIFHDAPELLVYPTVNDQIPFRMSVMEQALAEDGFSFQDVDVFVGRGGSAVPCSSGVMIINEKLYADTRDAVGGSEHPAKLGVMMAYELGKQYGKPAYTLNPTNVDELIDEARLTGIAGLYRNAQSHVLNQKAVASYHAECMGRKYEDCDFIVCHIDGGITVNAHRRGRMIDGNVGSGGDGAYTPTRIGSVPVLKLLDYIDEHGTEEVRLMCSRAGGFVSHFGTSNAAVIHQRMEEGDAKAAIVWKSMVYQIIKQIGAMAAVLQGRVEAILLTGGLVIYDDLVQQIKDSCGWIAPVFVYPGEREQEALAKETLKVLRHETEAREYTGIPAWQGFPFDREKS
ncbi:MAG: butyrate kinase [Erysipelotrichaceae bacterium]|nr:butyrate kinase [Erysipelotrichaceae bacterium]